MAKDESTSDLEETFLLLSDVETEDTVDGLQRAVTDRFNLKSQHLQVIGNLKSDSRVLTVLGHLLQLYRKHNIHSNDREMVLSYDDSVVTVQLCLAENNRKDSGDFEVDASKVIEIHKYLLQDKLGQLTNKTEEYEKLRERYNKYLKQCNLVDCCDVYIKLKDEISRNEALKKEVEETSFIVLNHTANILEKSILVWLSESRKCVTVTMECPLDDSSVGAATYVFTPCNVHSKMGEVTARSVCTPGRLGGSSITENYAESVLMAYLHLLVNTRSELALATVINIPERDLDHKAFTCVKREARKKKMSVYQTIVSHVMRIRLGGRSYAPNSDCHLNQHVKGLSQFTDLVQRLTTILEEDNNTRSAVCRIINILKNTIVKCKDNKMKCTSVESIASKLQEFADKTIDVYEQVEQHSPKRNASNGGSLVGRRTLRVIQVIVDRHSSKLSSTSSVDLLTDAMSSQTTPIRFPSLITKFRSPLESSPLSRENQSLAQRMMKKKKSHKNEVKSVVPRFQSDMNWVLPLHQVDLNSENGLVIEDFIPSKTIVHPGVHRISKGNSTMVKCSEAMLDQENNSAFLQQQNSENDSIVERRSGSKSTETGGKKRVAQQVSSTQPVNKRLKKQPSKNSKVKKTPSLQRGQKQLTAYFRL